MYVDPPDTPSRVLSFRHLLVEGVSSFLDETGMGCDHSGEALAELIIGLSRYREEGTPLFPLVFIADDLGRLLAEVGGRDPVMLGSGPRSPMTMRLALKRGAPLAAGRLWSLYFVRGAAGFEYGVFRGDSLPLTASPLERLRRSDDPTSHVIGVLQRGENVIELRGAGGHHRYIYLSGARLDSLPPVTMLDDFAGACSSSCHPSIAPFVRAFFRRVFVGLLQSSHGALVAVATAGAARPRRFVDGVLLSTPVDICDRVARYRERPDADGAASLAATSQLLHGMCVSDGVTIVGSDGKILAYNVFVRHPELDDEAPPSDPIIGGARRRTYDVLCSLLGRGLTAAFYHSQDGASECRLAPVTK